MGDIILDALLYLVAIILYYVEVLLCEILDIIYRMFEVFAGIRTITYKSNQDFLINVFFNNSVITTVFWGMACIGIVLTFVFALMSVGKKTFDSNEKHKMTYGIILTNIFKSVVLILLISTIITATITAANLLLQKIDYLFKNANEIENPTSIEFQDEDFATMFRILNTIGMYSMNPNNDNTYNINACFNAIRPDLQILERKGFFRFSYQLKGKDENGRDIDVVSWQSAIVKIGQSANLSEDLYLDKYNSAVNDAILNCMNLLKTNGSFKPLQSYSAELKGDQNYGDYLGRTMLLACTFSAAEDEKYNEEPSLTDDLRGKFYRGECDIYDRDEVEDAFSIKIDKWNHIVGIVGVTWLIKDFLTIVMNCIGRIFNMLLLYIVAPPLIATMPLDDGGKFKQWTTSFIIQAFGIFGTFIAVRLLVLFIPIIFDPQLVLFDDSVLDVMGKLVMVVGCGFTCKSASGMITGILADNAGAAAIAAGDVGGQAVGALAAVGKKAAGLAIGAGLAVGKGAANVTGLTTKANEIGEFAKNKVQAMKDKGGIIGCMKNGFSTNKQDEEKKKAQKEGLQDKADSKQRMLVNKMLGLDPMHGESAWNDLKGGAKGDGKKGAKTPPPLGKPAK